MATRRVMRDICRTIEFVPAINCAVRPRKVGGNDPTYNVAMACEVGKSKSKSTDREGAAVSRVG